MIHSKHAMRAIAALLIGATMLSSCATYDGVVYGGWYDGYYDNYYGPYTRGYWAADGLFWYWGPDRIYHRDAAGHFRRNPFPGGVRVRGERGWTRSNPPPGRPEGPRGPFNPPGH
jgi:hypothetical protein